MVAVGLATIRHASKRAWQRSARSDCACGTDRVVVRGQSSCRGSWALPADQYGRTHAWRIDRATNSVTVALDGWTYGDAPATPRAEAVFGAATATFAYADSAAGPWGAAVPTDAGTHYVRATVPATADYAGAESAASPFVIAKAPVGLSVSVEGWVAGAYDVGRNAPVVTGDVGGGAVTLERRPAGGSTWVPWDGAASLAAGSYEARAAVAETANRRSGVATCAFAVTQPAGTAVNVTAERAGGNWGGADLASTPASLAAAVGVGLGERAEVWVEVTGDVTEAGRVVAGWGSGNYTVAHVFDARLFKSVGGEVVELHELAAPVRVVVALPGGVPAVAPGMMRTWALVRVHDGQAALLDASYDAVTGMLSFETDRFSTYALAYRDESTVVAPTLSTGVGTPTQPAASPSPVSANAAPASLAQTGDPHDRQRATGLAMAGAALLVVGLIVASRRRSYEREA